jgi:hydroxyisourate hydrolase
MSRASALDPVALRVFNALEPDAAAALVAVWAAIPGWVDAVVAGRPYDTVDALAARRHARPRVDARRLDAALAHHPRIGQKPSGTGAEAAASTREQASMSTASDGTSEAIAAGNAAYEERFGRVFLIRAAGAAPRRCSPSSLAASATTTRPRPQRHSISCVRSPCCAWKGRSHEPPDDAHPGCHGRHPGIRRRGDAHDGAGSVIASGRTDEDGRLALGPDTLEPGTHTLTFATGDYFAARGVATFYPSVTVAFTVAERPHYHVPLLLSPFGYSTYRGS